MSKLIIVCGEPGVGKSDVADLLSLRTGASVLRTDDIRKDLFGPEPEYSKEESKATYDEMFDRAGNILQDGLSVILDATFMLQKGRERANRLAQKHTQPYDFTIVRVTAEPDVVKKRIREREDDASDADVSVYQSIRKRFEPVELPHVTVDNSGYWWNTMEEVRSKQVR
jgi:predicted kinase